MKQLVELHPNGMDCLIPAGQSEGGSSGGALKVAVTLLTGGSDKSYV